MYCVVTANLNLRAIVLVAQADIVIILWLNLTRILDVLVYLLFRGEFPFYNYVPQLCKSLYVCVHRSICFAN